ncbi:MAG: SLBB domain-containing protein [Cyclobacteriaceae bacterium]
MLFRKCQFLVIITLLLICQQVVGQDDVSEVNPSEISDKQLESAVEQAESKGYTETQVVDLARARGLSETQISQLRARIAQLKSTSGSGGIDENQLREELKDFDMDLEELDISDSQREKDGGRIFGYDIFRNKNLNFAPSVNIPTPENYILGAGDELIIDVWGASEKTYQLLVGAEGTVKIPNLGPVFVNGLTIEEASSKLLRRLTQIYAGLDDNGYGEKNTYAQVSLGRIRSIKINIIGEVVLPGTYTISSLSNILHALFVAGGPSRNGSLRNVQVFRNGKKIENFDVYDFLLYGKIASNITLRDQDVIMVPFYQKRVNISGEIKNPAIYEVVENESLQTVIDFAGGVTEEAYTRLVTVRRPTDKARRIYTIKNESFGNFELNSGDQITISRIQDVYENLVTISGAVNRPGEYEFTDSLLLTELVEKAEGITADAFRGRAQIVRSNTDLTLKNIEFNVDSVLTGKGDFYLKPNDVVKISSIFDLSDRIVVRIQGEVRNPQSIPFQDNLTVEDIILKAGGFKESAAKSFVEVARVINEDSKTDKSLESQLFSFAINENLAISKEASTFELKPYDLVTIRKSPSYSPLRTIEVEGEVNFPGKYVINKKDERISDFIKRAGGFTDEAYAKGGTLIRQTEYFDEEEAATVKRLRLVGLGRYDESTSEGTFQISRKEAIAIELEDIMKNIGGSADLLVKDGDVISIPKVLQTVRIRGEIHFSSNIIYNKTFGFKDYISSAGGFTSDAKESKAYIVYPNGSAERTRRVLWFKRYPKVEPGSEIVVPSRPEREALSAEKVIGFSSSILTMLLIVDRLTR